MAAKDTFGYWQDVMKLYDAPKPFDARRVTNVIPQSPLLESTLVNWPLELATIKSPLADTLDMFKRWEAKPAADPMQLSQAYTMPVGTWAESAKRFSRYATPEISSWDQWNEALRALSFPVEAVSGLGDLVAEHGGEAEALDALGEAVQAEDQDDANEPSMFSDWLLWIPEQSQVRVGVLVAAALCQLVERAQLQAQPDSTVVSVIYMLAIIVAVIEAIERYS